jgi:nitrate reductase assembly molybdenum cofactor insertion protein NarJ
MNETDKFFKVVSLLMQYPDEAYFRTLPEIKLLVGKMHRGPRRASIEKFITRLEGEEAIHLQEQYTALFDMSPPTTLNVTYHLWGDGEKRARLLTKLQQVYAGANLEKKSVSVTPAGISSIGMSGTHTPTNSWIKNPYFGAPCSFMLALFSHL